LRRLKKQFKRLSKKYPSLKTELGGLIADLANEPDKGRIARA